MFIFLFSFVVAESQFVCQDSSSSYKIGDNSTVCVYLSQIDFNSAITQNSSFLAFGTKVDAYSAVRLKDSYLTIHPSNCNSSYNNSSNSSLENSTNSTNNFTENSSNSSIYTNCSLSYSISVVVGSDIQTTQAPYIKNKQVAVVFSVVITMESGVIKLIEWDNACYGCNKYCMSWNNENLCAQDECASGSEGDCDPRIYISWLGTDKDGNNLLSASYRISQFEKYSISSLYSQATNKF